MTCDQLANQAIHLLHVFGWVYQVTIVVTYIGIKFFERKGWL